MLNCIQILTPRSWIELIMPDTLANSSIVQGLLALVTLLLGALIGGLKWFSTRTLKRIDAHDDLHKETIQLNSDMLSQIKDMQRGFGALEMQIATYREDQKDAERRHEQSIREIRKSTDQMIRAMKETTDARLEAMQEMMKKQVEIMSLIASNK